MFHCNGWCFPWTVTAMAGTHVCLPAVRGPAMWSLIAEHGVTHMAGAPIVMSTLLDTPAELRGPAPGSGPVRFVVAGAPPPAAVLEGMRAAGFDVLHVYGLTECYRPPVVNEWNRDWDHLPPPDQARLMTRQGVRYHALESLDVLDPANMVPVPADGTTMGEVMTRGNVVMKGYLKDPEATHAALAGGWFHTGDLTSSESLLKDGGQEGAPLGGELVLAIDPGRFSDGRSPGRSAAAEYLFDQITGRGARLPSLRRYAARRRALADGVQVPRALLEDIEAVLNQG